MSVLPAQVKGCDPCRKLNFAVSGAHSEVARARRLLRKHSLGGLEARYVAETKAALKQANDQDRLYLAHHAEAHPLPSVVLPGTDNDRAPSHRKPPLPPAADLAARLRAGETLEAVAAEYKRTGAVLQKRISLAGFNGRTGEPSTDRREPGAVPILGLPYDNRPWIDQALCAQVGGDAFFPDKGSPDHRAENHISEAKAICGRCPVRVPCLTYALDNDERFGIWGGLSERERRKLKKAAS